LDIRIYGVGQEENTEDEAALGVESQEITYVDHDTTGEEEEMPVTQDEDSSQLIENIKEEEDENEETRADGKKVKK
jgi:hypothetical protein